MSTNQNVDIKKLVEDLSSLTVLEAAKLAQLLEEKWGISASAIPTPNLAATAAPSAADAPAEKTEFDIKMISFGAKKLEVIRTIRSVLGLGLKESKELVEKSPVEIKKSISKKEAEELKSKLESAGAEVEMI